jgi:hypothetical protein
MNGSGVQVRLGRRLSNLVASELTTQRDALTCLFNKVTDGKGDKKTDGELINKYKKEIANLDSQIAESKA